MQHAILPAVADGDVPGGVPGVVRSITAAHALLNAFATRGVRFAFGIPGGLISPIFDALQESPEIRLVSTRHETMAAFCAMGSAVVTGSPALVLTTSGPGITNAITGIAAALMEEIPMIVIAGDVPSSAATRGAFQDASSNSIDSVALLRTATRWSARVDSAAGAVGAAEQAMRIACGDRPGPVFLSVPLDVGSAPARLGVIRRPERVATRRVDVLACSEAAKTLACAKRPLLVLGNGARGAASEIFLLATRLSIPVVTTPHAKGAFPESHLLHLGGIGFGGHPSASAYLAARPDVVCIFGSRLGDFASNSWSLPLEGTEATIQIDREPQLIGRNYPVSLGIVADAADAARSILLALNEQEMDSGIPGSGIHPVWGIRRVQPEKPAGPGGSLHPAHVLHLLQSAFPDAFWSCDIGEHCAHALHYLEIDRPDQFRTMLGFGSMGSGIGLAMGARLARPDQQVIAVCGDGGLAMHAGDLLTCVEEQIGCLFVVMNDGKWNIVDHGFQSVFGRVPRGLPSRVADLAGVARAFGAVGVQVSSEHQLEANRLHKLVESGRPVVLDVRVDPRAALSISTRSTALRHSAFGGGQ
jgi:acetolactate synthase-1/2/3 large subunit